MGVGTRNLTVSCNSSAVNVSGQGSAQPRHSMPVAALCGNKGTDSFWTVGAYPSALAVGYR